MPSSGESTLISISNYLWVTKKRNRTDQKSRIAIILALIIYGMAAKTIWDKREHLDGFLNPLNENPFASTITTEVEITTEERYESKSNGSSNGNGNSKEEATAGIHGIIDSNSDRHEANQYSVNIRVDERAQAARSVPAALRMRSITREVAKHGANPEAWLYARVAFLFFIALLITWVSPLSLSL